MFVAKMQLLGCDITRDVIANIETRRSSVNDKQIAFLAEALGVEIGELFPRNALPSRSRIVFAQNRQRKALLCNHVFAQNQLKPPF